MPLTTLDPQTALIIIDLQKGILSLPTAHPVREIVRRAATLADAFRRYELPVVLVNVDGSPPGRTEQARMPPDLPEDWADLVLELGPQPNDHRVTKQTPGAFTGTELEGHLRELGVTQVVLTGVATSGGVEATARHARELGFNVTLATDAMTDGSADAHENSIRRIFPRIGETGTTQDIIDLLGARGQA